MRDRAAGRQLALVQDRRDRIGPRDILLVTCLRNEPARMPAFVDYYRGLGVGHFLVIDNGSTDGFRDWAAAQPDVSVWHTEASYRASAFGMLWCNDLLRRHAHNRWCVVVDPDEFLVYPHMETRDLRALTQFLEDDKRPCLHALLVDAYSDRPLDETVLAAGDDPFAVCPFFDRDGYVQREGWGNGTWIQGGPRLRAHFHDSPAEAPALNKIPLIRWKRPYHYRHVDPRRLAAAAEPGARGGRGLADRRALPLQAGSALARQGRRGGGAGRALRRRPRVRPLPARRAGAEFFAPGISARYEGPAQLVALGLMSPGRWF